MSNYPPGVSGNEPEIAGYPERDMTLKVTCTYSGTASFSDGIPLDWECDYEGKADGTAVFYAGETWFYWECPNCGHENETLVEL